MASVTENHLYWFRLGDPKVYKGYAYWTVALSVDAERSDIGIPIGVGGEFDSSIQFCDRGLPYQLLIMLKAGTAVSGKQ